MRGRGGVLQMGIGVGLMCCRLIIAGKRGESGAADCRRMGDKKLAELQADHMAAGGFITEAEAQETVTQVHGPRPPVCERCASRARQNEVGCSDPLGPRIP